VRCATVALVAACLATACGDVAGRYHAFNEKTDRVRVGMAESEVRTIMGVPSSSPTGDVLVAECGQVGAASALVYDFVPNGWFERLSSRIIGSHPQITRLIVCVDSRHVVVKKDTHIVIVN
jgi:hypothetical protein